MTDRALIEKRLTFIADRVNELTQLAQPDLIGRDIRESRFIEHTLQIAIQATLDVASHIVSDERLGEPETNRELFDILCKHRWLSADLADRLSAMVGFRNVLVHGYAAVNPAMVQDAVRHRLPDFTEFITTIRQRL